MTVCVVVVFLAGVGGECEMEKCHEAYLSVQEEGVEEGPTLAYCSMMHGYSQCLKKGSCIGNLNFLSTREWLNKLLERNNCTSILGDDPQTLPQDPQQQVPTAAPGQDPQDVCQYEGSAAPAHCGLFGDPHLKTFGGEYMTCGAGGAWPLLNTPHLAIQVTNQPVGPASQATATTKVSQSVTLPYYPILVPLLPSYLIVYYCQSYPKLSFNDHLLLMSIHDTIYILFHIPFHLPVFLLLTQLYLYYTLYYTATVSSILYYTVTTQVRPLY